MARFSSTGSPILLHGPIATAIRQPGAPRAAADGSHHNGVLPMRILSCGAQIAALVLAASTALAQTPAQTLTVYTYDSFTAEWGPGPVVEKAFEAECGCDIEFIAVADGVAILNRLRLEGSGTRADIVLGLDANLMAEAKATGLFAPHGIDTGNVDVPGGWQDDVFVPYDYAHFAIVYDSEKVPEPPKSLAELTDMAPDTKLVIQDPRTSTPGLGFLLWMKAVYGDGAANAWERLRDKILTVTPGWSEAYGLFTDGEAEMVLSYTTSLAYHLIEDGTDRYRAAEFAEGHYLQVELAARTLKGAENPLAVAFLEFMTGPGFQDAIPQTNWMLPAGRTSRELHPAFGQLVQPERTLALDPEVIAVRRKAWIDEWLAVMAR
jgi:thiamine transport system substrate-binding protein